MDWPVRLERPARRFSFQRGAAGPRLLVRSGEAPTPLPASGGSGRGTAHRAGRETTGGARGGRSRFLPSARPRGHAGPVQLLRLTTWTSSLERVREPRWEKRGAAVERVFSAAAAVRARGRSAGIGRGCARTETHSHRPASPLRKQGESACEATPQLARRAWRRTASSPRMRGLARAPPTLAG